MVVAVELLAAPVRTVKPKCLVSRSTELTFLERSWSWSAMSVNRQLPEAGMP